MRAAIGLSIAFHVALFVWISLEPKAPAKLTHRTPQPPTEITVEAPKDPEPMVVALLDDHSVPPAALDPGPLLHKTPAKRHVAAIAATTLPSAATTTIVETPGTSTHSSLMTMRQPGDEHPTIATSNTAVIAALGGTPQWGHPLSGIELDAERQADLDRRDAAANAELQPDGQGMKSDHKTFKIKVAPDGTVSIKDKANWQQKSLFHAEFDVTDWAMRSHGQDPYGSYKKKILDDTREQRYEMGKQYRTQQLAMSGRFMEKNIERLVASVSNAGELKQGLFELWDDCAESGSDELVAGGSAARAQLVGYIKTKLPAGSPNAFTPDEIAQLNKRRKSKIEFAPYEG